MYFRARGRIFSWAIVAPFLCGGLGCGGATATFGDTGGDGGTLASDASAAPAPTDGATATDASGSASFNPSAIGNVVGSMSADGAAPATDGATPLPLNSSPAIVSGCEDLCTKEATAACADAGTLDSCLVGCRLIVDNASCATAAQNLFSCVGSTAATTCDASGNPTFEGCGIQEVAADACFLENADDPSLAGPCATYCAGVTAAHCPNDATSGCQGGCQVLGNYVPGCDGAWTAYVACANATTLTCGSDGKATAAGTCLSQALSFSACVLAGAAPALNDGGQ